MPVETIELSGSAISGLGPVSAKAMVDTLPTSVCLGRLPPDLSVKCVHLSDHWDESMMSTPPPASINRRDKAAASIARMYLNDKYGCCVISGKAHQLGVWSANDSDSGGIVLATDQEILSQYHGICGPGDNGCQITRVLDVMRDTGFTASGKRYKIDGYVRADWTNVAQTKVAHYLFGATSIGIDLPQAWTENAVWDVTNSRIVGGHDVTPIDYDETGVYVSSWGRIYRITWAAWTSKRWLSEFYVPLAPLWYGDDKVAPCGVNVATLKAALATIAGGGVPDVEPEPTPIPPTPAQPGQVVLARDTKAGSTVSFKLAQDMRAGTYKAVLLLDGDGPPPIAN